MNDWHRYRITHDPSGDEAEADDREAARLAARTLLEDNEFAGQCRVWQPDSALGVAVIEIVWADGPGCFVHTH